MIYAVHLFCYSALKTGREKGGRWCPSQSHGLAGREKHEEKTNLESKEKERVAIITTAQLLFNFVSCLSFVPPIHLVKVQDLSFFVCGL